MVVGISDHTEPDEHLIIPSVAVGLGAKIVEKHFTLDRSMTGSGHFFAADPVHLRKMVDNIRLTETALGDGKLGLSDVEQKAWHSARRSIIAEVFIPKGTMITDDMIGMKRPAMGLSPSEIDSVIGKTALRDIEPEQAVTADDIG